ncbi:MAG: patatin-like phospholipase family protein [Deltaproteobacteria bacterium]|nr:patatin-like phospholipase family protein [Deltaproteobacteria bacterium]
MKTIGLALGGGGAKCLAHVLMLEAFEELGVRPTILAGSSMGAVLAAVYASGRSVAEVREQVKRFVSSTGERLRHIIFSRELRKLVEMFDPEFGGGGGLIKGERFLEYLYAQMGVSTFEDLGLPLKVVAADFWAREQVVFDSGDLLTALKASMALPVVLCPVLLDDRVLVDGSCVNPVPYDLLLDKAEVVVGVDVMGSRVMRNKAIRHGGIPPLLDTVFQSIQIMQKAILTEKLKNRSPDILVEVDISGVRALEFYKAEAIYRQAAPAKEYLKEQLARLL